MKPKVDQLVEKLLEGDSQQDAILAVSFDTSKTIIWVVLDEKARKAIETLIAGKSWNDDVLSILGSSTCASNSIDRKARKEAERLEMEADYWIDLTDPGTWREALA